MDIWTPQCQGNKCVGSCPAATSALRISPKKRGPPCFQKTFGSKVAVGGSSRLGHCVFQYVFPKIVFLPFICGEGWEVARAPFLECAVKEEEMTIEHMLVLFITTPKELNGGEGELSR